MDTSNAAIRVLYIGFGGHPIDVRKMIDVTSLRAFCLLSGIAFPMTDGVPIHATAVSTDTPNTNRICENGVTIGFAKQSIEEFLRQNGSARFQFTVFDGAVLTQNQQPLDVLRLLMRITDVAIFAPILTALTVLPDLDRNITADRNARGNILILRDPPAASYWQRFQFPLIENIRVQFPQRVNPSQAGSTYVRNILLDKRNAVSRQFIAHQENAVAAVLPQNILWSVKFNIGAIPGTILNGGRDHEDCVMAIVNEEGYAVFEATMASMGQLGGGRGRQSGGGGGSGSIVAGGVAALAGLLVTAVAATAGAANAAPPPSVPRPGGRP